MSDIAACPVGVMSVMAKGAEQQKEGDATATFLLSAIVPGEKTKKIKTTNNRVSPRDLIKISKRK